MDKKDKLNGVFSQKHGVSRQMKEPKVKQSRDGELLMGMFLETLNFSLDGCGVTPLKCPYSEPWHSFPSGMSSHGKISGSVTYIKGWPPFERKAGDAIIVPPNVMLSGHTTGADGTPALARWSLFNFSVMRFADALSFFDLPKIVSGEGAERIGGINAELTRLRRAEGLSGFEAAARIKKAGFMLLEAIFDLVPVRPAAAGVWEAFDRVSPALEFIGKNFARRMTVKELSRMSGMSETRFHAAFKKATGSSPVDYLINRRVGAAQNLLASTDLSVGEIAGRCGYPDQFFFSKIFKSRAGSPPSEHRRLSRQIFTQSEV
jgi:AraC-like DNA-binding protein